MSNDPTYQRLIHTAEYQRLRRWQLTRHPLCQRCEQDGRITAATEVHHVNPVEDAAEDKEKARLLLDAHNLMSLCHQCHVAIHKEMGRNDKTRQKRVAKKQLENFEKKFLQG